MSLAKNENLPTPQNLNFGEIFFILIYHVVICVQNPNVGIYIIIFASGLKKICYILREYFYCYFISIAEQYLYAAKK